MEQEQDPLAMVDPFHRIERHLNEHWFEEEDLRAAGVSHAKIASLYPFAPANYKASLCTLLKDPANFNEAIAFVQPLPKRIWMGTSQEMLEVVSAGMALGLELAQQHAPLDPMSNLSEGDRSGAMHLCNFIYRTIFALHLIYEGDPDPMRQQMLSQLLDFSNILDWYRNEAIPFIKLLDQLQPDLRWKL